MADELDAHLTEDEDLARAKRFWRENGKSITAGIILGLASIGGYNGWQVWQKSQGENASTLYESLRAPGLSAEAATGIAADLMDDYTGTPYAANGALLMAKREVDASRPDEAKRYLQFVIDNSGDDGIKHIARIRLAMVLLAQGEADSVIKLLEPVAGGDNGAEFASRYYELSGDAHAMLGEYAQAETAWRRSEEALPEGSPNATVIKMKIENAGKFRD